MWTHLYPNNQKEMQIDWISTPLCVFADTAILIPTKQS